MPTVRPGYLTQTPTTSFGLGRGDTASSQTAFRSSPLFGTLTDAVVRMSYDQPAELSGTDRNAVISDGGYAYGSVPRYYRDAPDLTTTPVGGGGLPGTPYAPNIASPGAGNGVNPTAIPAEGVRATINNRGSGSPFIGNGLTSPSTTSAAISPTRLGAPRALGVGSGNSFRVRIL
jgi:hypothetical protein